MKGFPWLSLADRKLRISVIVQNVSHFCQSISTYSVYCNYVITYNTIHIRQIEGVKLFFSSQSTVKVPPFLCFFFSLCWTSQISRELIGSENGARYLHQSRSIVKQHTVSVNKPFSTCPQPPFQNEGRCQIYVKTICLNLIHIKLISAVENEGFGISEMVYWNCAKLKYSKGALTFDKISIHHFLYYYTVVFLWRPYWIINTWSAEARSEIREIFEKTSKLPFSIHAHENFRMCRLSQTPNIILLVTKWV